MSNSPVNDTFIDVILTCNRHSISTVAIKRLDSFTSSRPFWHYGGLRMYNLETKWHCLRNTGSLYLFLPAKTLVATWIIRELVQAIIAKQAEQYPSIHASCTDIFLLCSDWKGGHPDLREELYRTKEMNQPGQSSTIRGHKTDTKECIILFSPVIIAVRALYIRHQWSNPCCQVSIYSRLPWSADRKWRR